MKVVLQHLTKQYPGLGRGAAPVTALEDLSVELPDGQLISLLGPSGCGKSTTLNLICGLQMPTEGRILFGEEDVTRLPPEQRGVGLVFQNYALYPHLTVRQNILFPLQNLRGEAKLSKPEMQARADEAAAMVQIEGLMDRKPGELSGGQQQRVAIARALVKTPRVLLLDEPLSNLDARLRLQTREEIRRIQRQAGVTTVFVTHDQEEAMSISDLIVVMRAGVLQQVGAPQAVYDSPANLFVATFLGNPPINVFRGRVEAGQLYLGGDRVLAVPGVADGPVTAGIRPEGFLLRADGPLCCTRERVEVLGRDVSLLGSHPAAEKGLRAMLSAEDIGQLTGEQVRFALKPGKVFLFDPETGERLYTEV